MPRERSRTVLRRARCCWPLPAIVIAVAASTAGAAEPLSLEAVKARLNAQKEKIESLHLRVRRETALSVDPNVFVNWPAGPALPKHLGTDEVLVAFKADKRYRRVVELDYKPVHSPRSASEAEKPLKRYLDKAEAWTGTVLLERDRDPESGAYEYRSIPAEKASDCFPPPEYLSNIGLGISDPTGRDDALRNVQRMGMLPDLLETWPYTISKQREPVDGTPCIALEGRLEYRPPGDKLSKPKTVSDKLWLDLEHGLALRKRETRFDGRLVRVVNRDFTEVLPGVWFPKESRTESFAPVDAPGSYQDGPVLTRRMRLLLWVVNQVPDDLFETALTTPRNWPFPPFDLAPAYHIRETMFETSSEDGERSPDGIRRFREVWAVKGIGRREEVRKASKLLLLTVDTPRWHFVYDPDRDIVTASPSRLGDPRVDGKGWISDRARIIRWSEKNTALLASQTKRVGDKDCDLLTGYFPAGPISHRRGQGSTHQFDPTRQRSVSGEEFRFRMFWFDPATNLTLGKRCGCERTQEERDIDFPAPESVPRELFNFQVPRGAALEVNDPDLGRPIFSEGQTEPELRQ